MLSISKPMSVGAAEDYFDRQYSNGKENYYSEEQTVKGEYFGELAKETGLTGEITREEFGRLIRGQDPKTGEQRIRHVPKKTYTNKHGEKITTSTHRAGWDLTFNAPKSFSLAAGPGGDERLAEGIMRAAKRTLEKIEPYVMGKNGNEPAKHTGKMIACLFHHDSARPDRKEQYAAPHQHIHAFIPNMTRDENGQWRALETPELFDSQRFATYTFWGELVEEARQLGYETRVDEETGAPELKSITREYIEASSKRRDEVREQAREMKERMEAEGHTVKDGAGLRQAAAKMNRMSKHYDRAEMKERHLELDREHGDQAQKAVDQARQRGPITLEIEEERTRAQESITFAREMVMEKEAVADWRDVRAEAIRRNLTLTSTKALEEEIEKRHASGEFVAIQRGPWQEMTTQRMLDWERENLDRMQAGQGTQQPIYEPDRVGEVIERIEAKQGKTLNDSQRRAVSETLTSKDQIRGIQGFAGTGKTTTLSVIRESLEEAGYTVRGFAPLTRAAQLLADSGIETTTLQMYLTRPESQPAPDEKRYYIVDESSLADTEKVNEFLGRLRPTDRVEWVGDTEQHESIRAGAPFRQLQKAGMETSQLDHILRQQPDDLRQVIKKLSMKEVQAAVKDLIAQGRVTEIQDGKKRMMAIARDYCEGGGQPLVVCPTNLERVQANSLIRIGLQYRGRLSEENHSTEIYINRQNLSGAERTFAAAYKIDDVIRYSKGSKQHDIKAGEYWHVTARDYEKNLLTVRSDDGKHEVTYDPRRLSGVSVYRTDERLFSEGDRIQFRAPVREQQITTNELGTITKIEDKIWTVKLDSGRAVSIDLNDFKHVDHGYAVTSVSSQGLGAYRGIFSADTTNPSTVLNQRTAYVASSRVINDLHIYTDSIDDLAAALDRRQDKEIALDALDQTRAHAEEIGRSQTPPAPAVTQEQTQGMEFDLDLFE